MNGTETRMKGSSRGATSRGALARFWLVLAFAAIGFRCASPLHAQEPAPDAPRNASDAPSDARADPPPLDLARVRGYDLTVLAITGEAIGNEKARVSAIRGFSLNDRGQVAFMTEKSGGGEHLPVDLHISDGRITRLVARQRAEVPTTGPTMRWLDGFAQNDGGHLLIRAGRESQTDSEKHLWYWDGVEWSETSIAEAAIPATERGEIWTDFPKSRSNNFVFGDRGHVAVLRRHPSTIFLGDTSAVSVLADARNDPSDPSGDFSSFGSVFGLNGRGQILFSAARGRDRYEFTRLFRYDPLAESAEQDQPTANGTFRELARVRGRLRGTSLLLDEDIAHDPSYDAALNDRGQVVMRAQVTTSLRTHRYDEETQAILLYDDDQWTTIAIEGKPISDHVGVVNSLSGAALNSAGQAAFLVDAEDQDILLPLRYEPDGRFTVMARLGQNVVPSSTLRYVTNRNTTRQAPFLADSGLILMKAVLAPAEGEDPRRDELFPTDVALVVSDGRTLVEVFRLESEVRGQEAVEYQMDDHGFGALPFRDTICLNRLGQVAFAVKLRDGRHALCLCSPRFSSDGGE